MGGTTFNAVTRGQPAALAAIRTLIMGSTARTVLLVGPGSTGKTTLALDLAAGLLCDDPDPAVRPCRVCRGCRMVEHGNHPDLHRLAPEGPGGQVRIGDPKQPEPGTVRHLLGEMALLPAEGSARVAIIEQAHRLNDDAQNALLKLLEEPPDGATIVLCADDEESLLPTVRSRCARIRVGSAATREIEAWLGELGAADPPTASRVARLSGGRPGLALVYARSTDAARVRGELARGVLDMLAMGRRDRLVSVRDLLKSAMALDAALAVTRGTLAGGNTGGPAGTGTKRRKGRGAAAVEAAPIVAETTANDGSTADANTDTTAEAADESAARTPASARRAAAATLLDVWTSVARDLAIADAGAARSLREALLVDEIREIAPRVERAALLRFIDRANWVSAQGDANLNPELALDVLALAWPHDGATPAGSAPGARVAQSASALPSPER
jgi:DNA polymerase III gamma/tau subunit